MRNPRISQCTGKVKFDTFTMAEQVASRKTRRHEMRPKPYRCRFCGGFHIGNSNRAERKTPCQSSL